MTRSAANISGLTAIAGVEVGHHTIAEGPTGCTVILTEGGAVAGVDVRGGAPGTRETDLLDPVNSVDRVHAVVLAGGSAFGLDAASGVVRFLERRGIGYSVGDVKVPIVVGAILFDLWVGDSAIRPNADSGELAAKAANDGPIAMGSVGAGAGASVGKLAGQHRAMKGGLGTASQTLPNGLIVASLVVVNAIGDVIDPRTGDIVAGALRGEGGGGFADARELIRAGRPGVGPASCSNTTIGVVATNAQLSKAEATKVAQMAHDGFARTIYPAHTPMDGDTVFALATGAWARQKDVLAIGALAAETMADAILVGIRAASGLPGLPSAVDLDRLS